MHMAYSYSAISSFENCPLQFKLAYIDRVTPLRKNIEGFLGIRVHETLEKLYRDKLYEKHNSLEELLSFYNERWEREMCSTIFVTKDYDVENYRKMGERYITDYYERYKPFDEGKTIALEKKVFFPLNETHWIAGVIDRITEVNDTYEVHDYKTSLYFPTKKDVENDCQLSLYALALDYLYGVKNIELVWHFLAFDREIRLRKESYESAREELLKKIETIEKAKAHNEFPPKESSLCPYCSYQPICPLFRHMHELEEMSAEEMVRDKGFSLVNEYAQLSEKINELKHRKEMLGQRIAEWARENGVHYVYGSDKIANVKVYHNIQFTQKETVEHLLKREGLYEKYARLDAIKLAESFKNRNLPPQIMKALQELTEEKEVVRIYLRNAKREE
ncbi:MAG TPA: PD-(D/E)XK nuclease family protein [Thermoplasmatales archaeon]|nr:MAG: hypothetical protein DRN07_04270 [Thermoplasmata archaeon]HDN50294.1 PD-(D/E)XK nuclease family protein [Thermoplasmatales archaeon]